jgi:hypothetical protein
MDWPHRSQPWIKRDLIVLEIGLPSLNGFMFFCWFAPPSALFESADWTRLSTAQYASLR